MTNVRVETQSDEKAVYRLNHLAFGQPAEADLVEALRRAGQATISLVATDEDAVVGHILFSPVAVASTLRGLGLAPMAVLPSHQGRGIGSTLVRAGLERARELGYHFVVVLGHAHFYGRFGFRPSVEFAMPCPYEAPPEAFMAIELEPGCLRGFAGTVSYGPEFDAM